jgi:hypothetical protein
MKKARSLRNRFFHLWNLIPLAIALLVIALAMGCSHSTAPHSSGPETPIVLSLSTQTASLSEGNNLQLTAYLTNWKTDSTVTWSLASIAPEGTALGSVKANGLTAIYSAPTVMTTDSLTVFIHVRSNEDSNDVSVCSVTVIGRPTGPVKPNVGISPSVVTLAPGGMQQFFATVTGTTDSTVRWEVFSGVGMISATGLYTAPTTIVGNERAIVKVMSTLDTTSYAEAQVSVEYPPLCFRTQVWPILLSHCTVGGCHNAIDRTHDLDFTTYAGVMATVTPGDTTNSILHQRLDHFATSPDSQVRAINDWIESGAPYSMCPPDMGSCDTTNVSFASFIFPTIATNCLGCHSQRFASECDNIDLSTYATIDSLAEAGALVGVLRWELPYPQMPEWGPQLDECVINKFQAWVDQGARNN